MRRAARVDASQREIVETLRRVGAFVVSLAAVGGGVPDVLCGFRGRWHVMEVKRPAGPRGGASADGQRLRETQRRFIALAGAPVHVVRTPAEAMEAIGARTVCGEVSARRASDAEPALRRARIAQEARS